MIDETIIGMKRVETRTVESLDTALTMGSGDLEVYATPAMVALMEYTSKELIRSFLAPEETTVGISLEVSHVRATPVGHEVSVSAEITEVDGRKITLSLEAHDGEHLIGQGAHVRVVVDSERFMSRIGR
ncbi:thioesterase family protein [Proteiniclasticum sp.]|uniref:thioesterase family protein n=1 Tax=Proteiniclasticum sp. TaxID=2053595 RepID=UPI0028A1AF0D|nr:thioesterase family protein [Proteiniclasticum sp.]